MKTNSQGRQTCAGAAVILDRTRFETWEFLLPDVIPLKDVDRVEKPFQGEAGTPLLLSEEPL